LLAYKEILLLNFSPKTFLILISSIFICFSSWLFFAQNPGVMKSAPKNKTNEVESNYGEFYYLRGCDNLNMVNSQLAIKTAKRLTADCARCNEFAEKDFSKTIELIPDCANAYWKRAYCRRNRWQWYGKKEDYLAEIADYKKAIKLSPATTEVRYDLDQAYINSGKN